jgi:hypothetical protein
MIFYDKYVYYLNNEYMSNNEGWLYATKDFNFIKI